jgi:hypothetical protein
LFHILFVALESGEVKWVVVMRLVAESRRQESGVRIQYPKEVIVRNEVTKRFYNP